MTGKPTTGTSITAAQAAQQNNRDTAGKYAVKQQPEDSSFVAPAADTDTENVEAMLADAKAKILAESPYLAEQERFVARMQDAIQTMDSDPDFGRAGFVDLTVTTGTDGEHTYKFAAVRDTAGEEIGHWDFADDDFTFGSEDGSGVWKRLVTSFSAELIDVDKVRHFGRADTTVWGNGNTEHFREGFLHNEHGPAVEYASGAKGYHLFGHHIRTDYPDTVPPRTNPTGEQS